MKKRLSKLQKNILAVLEAMNRADWENFYKEKQPTNKPPYWQKVRREYFDTDGCGFKCHFENGVKGNVEKITLKQRGFDGYVDARNKTEYFFTPHDEKTTNRFGYPIAKGASSFSVSFSRSLRTLLEKKLIEAKYWKKLIIEVRLNVNNQNIDINNKTLLRSEL